MEEYQERLVRSLIRILDAIKKQIDAVAENAKTGKESKEPAPPQRISAEINFLPEVTGRYYAEQDKSYGLQRRIFWIGVLTLLALTVYTRITYEQWKAMLDSNAINREALESVQRAFVNIGKTMQDNPVVIPGQNEIRGWEFRPRMANSGSTPTRNASSHANFLFLPAALPADFSFPDLGAQTPDIPFILGPKEEAMGALLNVPFSAIEDVKGKKTRLFFWGWATYNDIFPKTPQHISMFCIELAEVRGPLTPNTGYQFLWSLCGRHNCADDECRGEPYGTPTKVWR